MAIQPTSPPSRGASPWARRLDALQRYMPTLFRYGRIFQLAARSFQHDRCMLRASALTVYVLFAIVPAIALAFGIAKGFDFDKRLRDKIEAIFPEPATLNNRHPELRFLVEEPPEGVAPMAPENGATTDTVVAGLRTADTPTTGVIATYIDQGMTLLEQSKGGVLAGFGLFILLWSVFKVLSDIEGSFNDIWGARRARSFLRKFSDYFALTLIAPILIGYSSSLSLAGVGWSPESDVLDKFIDPLQTVAIRLTPYITAWVLFTFIFIFVPNTHVSFVSALWAGLITSVLFMWTKEGYIQFQVRFAGANPIYASFSALPLFIFWLQLNWTIVLFGAELCVAHQNLDFYGDEEEVRRVSHASKRLLALRMMQLCGGRFQEGAPPVSDRECAEIVGAPLRLCGLVFRELAEAGLVMEARPASDDDDPRFAPAVPLEQLTVANILRRYDSRGVDALPWKHSPEMDAISQRVETFAQMGEHSSANTLFAEATPSAPLLEYADYTERPAEEKD